LRREFRRASFRHFSVVADQAGLEVDVGLDCGSRALGADGTAQIVPRLAHGIDERAAKLVLEALA